MTRLRSLKRRVLDSGPDFPRDVRNLNDPSLFRESAPMARLWVRAIPADTALMSILDDYGLEIAYRSYSGTHFELKKRDERPGGHKSQTIALFLAALEIHRLHPRFRGYLSLANGLRVALLKRDRYRLIRHRGFRNFRKTLTGDGLLTVDAGILSFLAASGLFTLSAGNEGTTFDRAALDQFHHELMNPRNQTTRASAAAGIKR